MAIPVYWAETFVDTTRYRGTCYRAANWQVLGQTQGRGKDDRTHRANRSIKGKRSIIPTLPQFL